MNTGELRLAMTPRIRGTAHSDAIVRQMLSLAQRTLNAGLRLVITTATLITEPLRQIYNITELLPDAVFVTGVQDGTRDLSYMADWRELCYVDRAWFRRLGFNFEAYSMIGRDLLVLHPSLPDASSVTVSYVKLVTELSHDTIELEIPNDRLPLVTALAEALLLLRERRYSGLAETVQRIADKTGRSLRGKK